MTPVDVFGAETTHGCHALNAANWQSHLPCDPMLATASANASSESRRRGNPHCGPRARAAFEGGQLALTMVPFETIGGEPAGEPFLYTRT